MRFSIANDVRIVLLGLALWGGAPIVRGEEPPANTDTKSGGWRALGRVTDHDGKPMTGVDVTAHCGVGSLRRSGVATSGADGRYVLAFGPAFVSLRASAPITQAAIIAAHKAGYFEANLNRQGDCMAAAAMPLDEELEEEGGRKDRLFLPGRALELNFVMLPAGRIAGRLEDEHGKPPAGYSVALRGHDLPPAASVLAQARADEQGRFALEDVPTTYRFQFTVRKADPRPPWDDTWASAALRFERPEAGDLRAWFGAREIRLQKFVLRVSGSGRHQRDAAPIAANLGALNLTDPAEVREHSDTLLSARSAVLTIRNGPPPDLSKSLVTESVPAPIEDTPTRLRRTSPSEAGEFTLSFENPRGFALVPGEHQVIFQVWVGASQRPVRDRIFRQLDARKDGRYRVAVTIPPKSIDDSRVVLTFVTIQPEHDAWVKAFFLAGKGTAYKGLWAGDGAPLPAIPLETPECE
jgi:hypothetical protein